MQLTVFAVGMAVSAVCGLFLVLVALLAGVTMGTAATRGVLGFGAFAGLTLIVSVVVSFVPGLAELPPAPTRGASQVDFVLPASADGDAGGEPLASPAEDFGEPLDGGDLSTNLDFADDDFANDGFASDVVAAEDETDR